MMTPREIVQELDKHIVGQTEAKRAVSIALRNRHRRMQVAEPLRSEITPKNILMIGPTGVGKTEIARRLAKLAKAPFIKVEATKFTEVGYVGRDVESIIRDLADISVKMTREEALEKVEISARHAAMHRILQALEKQKGQDAHSFAADYENKLLDDEEIEIEVSSPQIGVEIMAPPGMEEMTNQLQNLFQNMVSDKTKMRTLKIKEARTLLEEEEAHKLIDFEALKIDAIRKLEENGIVFLDEIDKICQRNDRVSGGDVSREGVQRDLLPLVEGCTVSTKYGMVRTDHILFIASGAFHLSKPSDLVPELQGRLPIRVELKALTAHDFVRILTEPDASLTKQYQALLATENMTLHFTEDGIRRIAEIAFSVNESTENIGARRLHTVLERLLEHISFEACDLPQKEFTIDAAYANQILNDFVKNDDLSRFIL